MRLKNSGNRGEYGGCPPVTWHAAYILTKNLRETKRSSTLKRGRKYPIATSLARKSSRTRDRTTVRSQPGSTHAFRPLMKGEARWGLEGSQQPSSNPSLNK